MKVVSTAKPEKNTAELVIRVEGQEFADAMDKSYKKNAPKLNIPGFRKGKAPKATVIKYVGEEYFYDDAVNNSCYDAYLAAVEQEGFVPVDRPDISIDEINGEGYTFKAVVTTKPEVSIKGYKGLKAEREDDTVTDEEFNAELDKLAERGSRMVDIDDRPAADGDMVCIDFDGYIDGVPFEGGKSEHSHLTIGDGQFIPGFEEQIVGHSIGDEFDVNVTFPEDYHAEALKGKPAVFKCKLHEIKKKEMPEMDDEFAKDVSEFDTLDALKADMRAKLQESKTKSMDSKVENDIVDEAAKLLEGDIPACMFANKAEDMVEDFGYRLQAQGLDLNTYLQYTKSNPDAMKQQFLPEAEHQVRSTLALEKIAELEKLEATAEDLEERYKELAERYSTEIEKVKAAISEKEIKAELKINKAIDFLKENAKITKKKAK